MRHASLFSGIGGFDLAALWMGWENVFQVEKDAFCQKVLEKNFPQTTRYADIKEFDGTKYMGAIDILTGGFPCQPFSTAGKRKGTEDDRYLWPEMLRIIGEIRPTYVVGENVYGLVNWSKGLVLEQVQADLEIQGYEVGTVIIPACSVGAPHGRERIWFIAYRNSQHSSLPIQQWRQDKTNYVNPCRNGTSWTTSNTYPQGFQEWIQTGFKCNAGAYEALTRSQSSRAHSKINWSEFPTQSPVCGRDDGLSNELDIIRRIENEKRNNSESIAKVEEFKWSALRAMWEYKDFAAPSPRVYAHRICNSVSIMPYEGTLEGWELGKRYEETKELRSLWSDFYSKTFEEAQNMQQGLLDHLRKIERRKKMEQKQRVSRIKGLGNAIVPQVAFQIFNAIEKISKT